MPHAVAHLVQGCFPLMHLDFIFFRKLQIPCEGADMELHMEIFEIASSK